MRTYFQIVKRKPAGVPFVDYESLKVFHSNRLPRIRLFDGVAYEVMEQWVGLMAFKIHWLIM